MSELLRQVERANEKNRRNVEVARQEFARKLALLSHNIPMPVTRYGSMYIAGKNGKARVIRLSRET